MALMQDRVVPYGEARLGLLTHSFNYGTGVFGGIRGYWNSDVQKLYVFRLPDHMRRLHESARLLRMELGITEEASAKGILELLASEGLREDCYVRALAFFADEAIGVRLHGL